RAAKTQVLISGAGPTGLLLAVELQRRGVDCLLVDELDAPRGWDRATVIHPRSMEIFEALGLAEQFLDEGVRVRAARFRSGGEVLGELDLELTDSGYGFDLGLSEETTERLLTGHLESIDGSRSGPTATSACATTAPSRKRLSATSSRSPAKPRGWELSGPLPPE